YGIYDISKDVELHLPGTDIHFQKNSDGRLSYLRKDSEDNEIRKSIPPSANESKIELSPVLPLHLPAQKTNDLMFLRLDESILVEKNATVSFVVQFPIEIGIFKINSSDGSKQLFDCLTCEPMHSRFALYGTPEVGHLCMYSKVKIVDKDDTYPYVFAKMKITISNELDHGVFVGKLVFPITNHTIYYLDNSSEVHIDDITCKIREDTNKEVIKIKKQEFSNKDNDWKIVSYSNKEHKSFVMDMGFD
ncbi:MAG: DUF432 domain-containing protein, partial [Nitrosopumilus sp.]|nr:DUF432 domain-containing protein [Nitrosopumilus sp.]NNL37016.1 DUF432 domain-containing protein [Nitrosopumilus sp.]